MENQKYALTLAEDGRIMQATYECFANDKTVLVDALPDGDAYEYRYVNGEYIYDPLPVPEQPDTATADDVLNAMLGVTV